MELSKNILDGISIAGDISKISDNVYSHLLTEICEVAVSRPIRKGRDCKSLDEKTAYSSLLSFLLEAAKHDADPMSLSSVLEECRMDSSRISMFQNKFQENKDKIQSQLSRIGRSFDHVIDVKWRQDYVIKSSNCKKVCELNYIICLKTWNPLTNSTDDVTFACSMEQLQDLVLKLKDATKCIERNAI
ncbi:COMM domain-containing protein 3-like isoform X3 [Stegodyphus dumicola]|uniref:COMM domain-containing protein 3-like isoform X3 n=1 Tax=Stegodyphus dumicola TaxID=202533 RepID=UPI0015B06954|nr:COMM domain-containing protein 3-like isoform X3 [Stegodyphus dumicola]